jgi:hypothetical protein
MNNIKLSKKLQNWLLGRFFWLKIALFITVLIGIRYTLLGNSQKCSIWSAIPEGPAIFFAFQSNELEVFDSLPSIYPLQQFKKELTPLLTLMNEPAKVLGIINSNTPEIFNWLFITEYHQDLQSNYPQLFREDYTTVAFRGIQLYESKHYTIAQYKHLLLVGANRFQVEASIKKLKKTYQPILPLSKQDNPRRKYDFQCFIGVHHLDVLLSPFLSDKATKAISTLKEQEIWLTANLWLENKRWHMDGIWQEKYNTILKQYFSSQQEDNIYHILPEQIACFYVGDKLPNTVKMPIPLSYLSRPIALGWLNVYDDAIENYQFAVQKTKGDPLVAIRSQLKEGIITATPYQMFEIYSTSEGNYFTLIEDYVIQCFNLSSIENWIDQFIASKTLNNTVRMNWNTAASGHFYWNSAYVTPFLKWGLKEKYQQATSATFEKLGTFIGHANMQNEQIQGYWESLQMPNQQAQLLWKYALFNHAIIPPSVITLENGKRLIFTQDEDKRLYCIDETGELKWVVELEAKLLSPVFYLNQQLLFNTAYRIHLTNLQGQAVQSYPFELQSLATESLTPIDFNQTGEYYYLIPCENGNIYGYQLNGYPMEGWNPMQNIGLVRQPIRHFQHKNQDFILILADSTLSVFARYGNLKFPPYQHPDLLGGTLDYQISATSERIVIADRKGYAHIVNLKGNHFRLLMERNISGSTKFAFADVCNDERNDYILLNDNKLSVFAYDNENKFKKVSEYSFAHAQDTVFSIPPNIGTVCKQTGQITMTDGNTALPNFQIAGSHPFVTVPIRQMKQLLFVTNDDLLYAYQINLSANQ